MFEIHFGHLAERSILKKSWGERMAEYGFLYKIVIGHVEGVSELIFRIFFLFEYSALCALDCSVDGFSE